MYSICKELLDGLRLSELAGCVGLSLAQVRNILKHAHARNNRALLFSLACALVIHCIDKIMQELPAVRDEVNAIVSRMNKVKELVTVSGKKVQRGQHNTMRKNRLHDKMNETVRPEIIELGRTLRRAVESELCNGPNGKHYIRTVLLGSLLPTVGFHVLSRTGHADITEAFWFRLTYTLHATNHLKYQELSLFYAFLRGILPSIVVSNLFEDTPGLSVLKLPSFTGGNKYMMDKRGWTYVPLDEALEMLIVPHLKSICRNLLQHLENAAAWLQEVSFFRTRARRLTEATRAYGRFRGSDDVGENGGPLQFYDRNTLQSRTVLAMLSLMRERGFLSTEHRGSEWLTNVFCDPPRRMANIADQ